LHVELFGESLGCWSFTGEIGLSSAGWAAGAGVS
jgi:hypothetical protein